MGGELSPDSNVVHLEGSVFLDADLRCAFLGHVSLRDADLTHALLDSTTFLDVDLTGVRGLTESQLATARIDPSTHLPPELQDRLRIQLVPTGVVAKCST
jgi:hypothetical protein